MNITNELINKLTKKIYLSKLRLLSYHGFFGSLLIGMNFVLVTDEKLIRNKTGAATDGKTIYFLPEQLDAYSNEELDIVIMHELMHIALKHIYRGKGLNKERYNKACDIVVNSNIKHCLGLDGNQELKIQGVPLEHKTPTGKEGKFYSAEEVYDMLEMFASDEGSSNKKKDPDGDSQSQGQGQGKGNKKENKENNDGNGSNKGQIDDHFPWGNADELDDYEEDLLDQRILKAYEIGKALEERSGDKSCGTLPLGIERQIKELKEPQINWKEYLQAFIQENVVDYSFSPPDRRFQDSDFILPDLNDTEVVVKNILFMVDTSGSMSKDEITDCFSEVNGAIQQYDGKLQGYLGFFDANVPKVVEFDYDADVTKIVPLGGGGTDFSMIFKYVEVNMLDKLPASIVILTDGYCDWPKEKETLGIPVLWIINNEDRTPPFGKVARIHPNKVK